MILSLLSIWKEGRKHGESSSANAPSETQPELPEFSRLDVVALLKHVIDPEVGINIIDLGLVYDIVLYKRNVQIVLTMTTPACPLSGYITKEIRSVLNRIPGLGEVRVDLVWRPAWSPRMMDPETSLRRFGRIL
jgi:metal-sulfur cluster biosynthetic enzyme